MRFVGVVVDVTFSILCLYIVCVMICDYQGDNNSVRCANYAVECVLNV